jgi:diacylglycerol kinase (ATP)
VSAPPEGEPVALLVNVQSRRGRRSLGQAQQLLTELGVSVRPVVTNTVAEAEAVLRAEIGRAAPLVIVGGGDGTLSHAAELLKYTQTALGVLPLGTGNTFARSVGVPLDLAGAAEVIRDGHRAQIDVGLVNGRAFLNSVGLGWSAQIARSLTSEVKARLGLLAWPVVGLSASWRHRALRLEIDLGPDAAGTEPEAADHLTLKTHQLLIANGRYVAGPLRAAQEASIADQQLDLLAFGTARPGSFLLAGLRWARGGPTWRVQHSRAEVRSLAGPVWVSIDGEVVKASTLQLSVSPLALTVLVPAGYRPAEV